MSLKHLIFSILFCSYSLLLILSCKKSEVKVVDENPIQILTLPVSELTLNNATLNGEIGYLNDEKIIEVGFVIINTQTKDLQKITLPPTVDVGMVSYKYITPKKFQLGAAYQYNLYLKTDKQLYQTPPVYFVISSIQIDRIDRQHVSPGDVINITGDFNEINDQYVLKIRETDVPYSLDQDKKTLTFKIPESNVYHMNEVNVVLQNKNLQTPNFVQTIANFKVLAKLLPPEKLDLYYTDRVSFKKVGIHDNYYYPEFKVIIGNNVLDLESGYDLYNLNLTSNKLRIGYFNGRDTVIFEDKLNLIPPQREELRIISKVVHPGNLINIAGAEFTKYFGYNGMLAKVGSVPTVSQGWALHGVVLQYIVAPNMDNGRYTVSLISKMYPDFVSSDRVDIQKLAVTDVDLGTGYLGSVITAKGNFIAGNKYIISWKDNTYESIEVTDGQAKFKIHYTRNIGTDKLSFGYINQEYNLFYGTPSYDYTQRGISIEKMYPTVANYGDIITLEGHGIAGSHYMINVGDAVVYPFYADATTLKFVVPPMLRKGLMQISIDVASTNFISPIPLEIK